MANGNFSHIHNNAFHLAYAPSVAVALHDMHDSPALIEHKYRATILNPLISRQLRSDKHICGSSTLTEQIHHQLYYRYEDAHHNSFRPMRCHRNRNETAGRLNLTPKRNQDSYRWCKRSLVLIARTSPPNFPNPTNNLS